MEIEYEDKNYRETSSDPVNANTQYERGLTYLKGEDVKQDYKEAVEWFAKAAEQGNSEAQFNLGYCYYYGKGVDQDYKEAVKWYRRAGEKDHHGAQFLLHICYMMGDGVKASHPDLGTYEEYLFELR